MTKYKKELVNEIKSTAISENYSDREAFFQIYCEKLANAELVEDVTYSYFTGKGSKNRTIQIDGYAYSELDEKLTLFIIPELSYFDDVTLTKTEADTYFKRAKYFCFDADKVISSSEESTAGYDLAWDISNGKLKYRVLEIILLTDYTKSNVINIIESTVENNVRVDYSIFDITRIKQMDDTINGKEALVINLKNDFDFDGIEVLPASQTEEYKAYLCNIPGELLAKMYDKYQSRLLEGNVRSFLQTKGKVNKGIRSTILNNPDMFFAYNNGIAATAESITTVNENGSLKITGFKSLQIVNGGQTTASLANAWTNDVKNNSREQISRIFVPMKISVIATGAEQELIPNISRYANSQNKVSDADLASNHPFHIKVEEISRIMSAPPIGGMQFGTYWYYERANGQFRQETYKATASIKKRFEMSNPKNQLFKKVDLAKFWNIYLQNPQIASAGAQKSFNKFSDWMMKKWDKNSNMVNEDFYRKTIALAILYKKSDYIVRQQEWYSSYKANIIAYTLAIIFYKVEKDFPDLALDLNHIWKKQDLTLGWSRQIKLVSKVMYEHLISETRTIENVTEWAKKDECWRQAKEINFDYNEEFLKELMDKKAVINEEMGAIKEQKAKEEVDVMMQIYELGLEFWQEVTLWGEREKIWNINDKKFLKMAVDLFLVGKVPSEKQFSVIAKVLDKAQKEGFMK